MAYFNIDLLYSLNLSLDDLWTMQLVFQNTIENREEELSDRDFSRLLTKDMLSIIKGKKGETDVRRTRLSAKGKETYNILQLKDVSKEDLHFFEYVEKLWDALDKPIGNKLQCKKLIAQFFANTGFSRKSVYVIIKDYYLPEQMSDEKGHGKYIPSLENFIWKPVNIYSNVFKVEESRLYDYIGKYL